jgi:hypothetical protein
LKIDNGFYLSSGAFFIAAFLAYHEGAWLSVSFAAFSIGSAVTATKWL